MFNIGARYAGTLSEALSSESLCRNPFAIWQQSVASVASSYPANTRSKCEQPADTHSKCQ